MEVMFPVVIRIRAYTLDCKYNINKEIRSHTCEVLLRVVKVAI